MLYWNPEKQVRTQEPNLTASGLIQGQTQHKIQIPKRKISTAFQSTKQWVVWCEVKINKKREKKGPFLK